MTIKVYYPHGGKKFLLEWHTHNEQSHIVLANTEQSMFSVARKICLKMNADVRECFALEIVSPSAKFVERQTVIARKDAIESFFFQLIASFYHFIKCEIDLPGPFQRCSQYVPEDGTDFEDPDKDGWRAERHYDCKNCHQAVSLVGMSKEELFDKYYDGWLKLHPVFVDKKLVESKAPQANDDDEVWMASSISFGHHGRGVTIKRIPDKTLNGGALFFFKRLYDIDTTALKNELYTALENIKAENLRKSTQDRAERAAKEKADRDALIALFARP